MVLFAAGLMLLLFLLVVGIVKASPYEKSLVRLEDKTCSTKLGAGDGTTKDWCFAVHIRIPHLTSALLEEALGPEDSNFLVRRAYIDTHEHRSSVIGPTLDHFVTTRPWWIIRREPFMELRQINNNNHHHHENKNKNNNNDSAALSATAHIFLQRYEARLEPHLWQIAAVQYPPAQYCEHTRLFIGHMVNSGWGSMISMYATTLTNHHWAIFATYDSNTNLPNESVMYASPSLCPDIVNKWLCAFLVTTNCTFPTVITQCFPDDGKKNCWKSDFPIFTSASSSGQRIAEEDYQKTPGIPAHLPPSLTYHKEIEEVYKPFENNKLLADVFYDAKNNHRTDRLPYSYTVLKSYGQLLRPNALYRLLIAQRIQQFWEDSKTQFGLEPLHLGTPCTAIHIRRGDRSKDGIDMNAFCKNHTRHGDGWGNCTNREGEQKSCGELSDLGCFGFRPFGGVTLQEYLDRAYALHSTRNVFIMTDAAEWLQRERQKVDPSFKIYSISSQGSVSRQHTHQNATSHGVEYHASLRLVQQCQALVGHWGSAGQSFFVFFCFFCLPCLF